MADSQKSTERDIREKIDELANRVQELENENLSLKEENIELLKDAEEAENPRDKKYQMIEGTFWPVIENFWWSDSPRPPL